MLNYSDGGIKCGNSICKTKLCGSNDCRKEKNTLILLQIRRNDAVGGLSWINGNFDEEPPEYETKTGRKKKRDSVIGILHGGRNTLTGIVDVAMVGSMYGKGNFNEMLNSTGWW